MYRQSSDLTNVLKSAKSMKKYSVYKSSNYNERVLVIRIFQ